MSLFSTIIAFWFGSRVMEKQEKLAAVTASQQPQLNVKVIPNKAPVTKAPKKPAGTGRDK
jgi:hypothetical protein